MDDEAKRLHMLENFITSVEVVDLEWDVRAYTDVQLGVENGMLIITGQDDMVQSVWAPGSWMHADISREPRLELTGDDNDSDGETDGHRATQRDTDLPRNGA